MRTARGCSRRASGRSAGWPAGGSGVIGKALPCDYDGPLASEDRIGAEALAALAQARAAGLRLILVTGRTFFELLRVCEPIDLFDAGVAENGGGLYFPALGAAENALDCFEACGWTACPVNAVPELKDRADWIFPGEDGTGVARAIAGPLLGGLLPVARSPRHRLAIGWVAADARAGGDPRRGGQPLVHR